MPANHHPTLNELPKAQFHRPNPQQYKNILSHQHVNMRSSSNITASQIEQQQEAIEDAMERLLIRPTQTALQRLEQQVPEYFEQERAYLLDRRHDDKVENLFKNQQTLKAMISAALKPINVTSTGTKCC
jgi:methionyl-tRNA synthetase